MNQILLCCLWHSHTHAYTYTRIHIRVCARTRSCQSYSSTRSVRPDVAQLLAVFFNQIRNASQQPAVVTDVMWLVALFIQTLHTLRQRSFICNSWQSIIMRRVVTGAFFLNTAYQITNFWWLKHAFPSFVNWFILYSQLLIIIIIITIIIIIKKRCHYLRMYLLIG